MRKLGGLDARCFPHIVDIIFENAQLASLLAMRRVSKTWKKNADRRIAYHLVLKGNSAPIEVHSGLLGEHFMTVTAASLDQAKELRPSWATFVRVIDIDATSCHKDLCRLLSAWKVDAHYETLRFVQGPPVYDKYSKLARSPKRIVFLHQYSSVSFNSISTSRLIYDSRFIGSPSREVSSREGSSVIIHHTQAVAKSSDGNMNGYSPAGRGSGCPLVVIVHEWSQPATASNIIEGNFDKAFEGNFGDTYCLIRRMIRTPSDGHGVTVVGLEKLAPGAGGLTAADLDGMTMEQAFTAPIKKAWAAATKFIIELESDSDRDSESEGESGDESERRRYRAKLNARRFSLAFKTEEEYRSGIDKAEYEIEMSPVISCPKHPWRVLPPPYIGWTPRARRHSL